MNRITLWVLLSVLSAVQVVQAGETTMIPIKGEINASGEVDLIIRVYDQPEGGRLLYQLTKMVTAEDQIFDDEIDVPSELFSANPQVFVGFASASAPEDEIGERMQFPQARDMSEDDLDTVDNEGMGSEVSEEQAIDEELEDPGLAAEIAMADGDLKAPIAMVVKSGVQPSSASGCNLDVCIYLRGSGLHVDRWRTTARPTGYTCSYAAYWVRGVIETTSNTICGDSGDIFVSIWDDEWFLDGTVVCNTWVHIAGKPCKKIHR